MRHGDEFSVAPERGQALQHDRWEVGISPKPRGFGTEGADGQAGFSAEHTKTAIPNGAWPGDCRTGDGAWFAGDERARAEASGGTQQHSVNGARL